MWTFLLHASLSLSVFFSCFLLCDWLLMVRMRPCAEGAQAPHWLPLCSCYCCHCSCAVSGQSHNASPFSFINLTLSLSCTQSCRRWLIALALFLLMFLFCLFPSPYFFFFLPCSTTSCLFPLFSYPYLSHLSLLLMFYHHLSSPAPQLTSQSLSVSRQHFPRLTWLWTSSHALCIFPHLSLSVSGNRPRRLSLLTSEHWCGQTLAKTDRSLLICIQTFVRLF